MPERDEQAMVADHVHLPATKPPQPGQCVVSVDYRLADARAELLGIQSAVVETQRQLAELGERVSAALAKLGRRG